MNNFSCWNELHGATPFDAEQGLGRYGANVATQRLLPAGYTQLDYVQNLSNSYSTYLTLNHKFNSTHSNLIIDYQVLTFSSRPILGSTNDARTSGFRCKGDIVYYFPDSADIGLDYMGAIHHYEIGKEKLYIDGTLIKEFTNSSNKTSVYNLLIGDCADRNHGGVPVDAKTLQKIGRVTLSYDDVLLFDLIPCKNPDGLVGFYDIVNREFRRSESGYDWSEPTLGMQFSPIIDEEHIDNTQIPE